MWSKIAKKNLCIIGGVISIISVFLPTFYIIIRTEVIHYWIFGLIFWYELFFYFDLVGTVCIILIISSAILVIASANNESKIGLLGGILIIVALVTYYGIVEIRFSMLIFDTGYMIILSHYTVIPSFGFFTALIGGIISIIGSNSSKWSLK